MEVSGVLEGEGAHYRNRVYQYATVRNWYAGDFGIVKLADIEQRRVHAAWPARSLNTTAIVVSTAAYTIQLETCSPTTTPDKLHSAIAGYMRRRYCNRDYLLVLLSALRALYSPLTDPTASQPNLIPCRPSSSECHAPS